MVDTKTFHRGAEMNIEQIKKILKILARESCDLYSFNIYSDGSGAVEGLQGETICAWDDEEDMYTTLLAKVTPPHCAKETLLKLLENYSGFK